MFEGGRYSHKGFLYKNFPLNSIVAEGIKPTLSELEKFEDDPTEMDLDVRENADSERVTHNFVAGDVVEVIEGNPFWVSFVDMDIRWVGMETRTCLGVSEGQFWDEECVIWTFPEAVRTGRTLRRLSRRLSLERVIGSWIDKIAAKIGFYLLPTRFIS